MHLKKCIRVSNHQVSVIQLKDLILHAKIATLKTSFWELTNKYEYFITIRLRVLKLLTLIQRSTRLNALHKISSQTFFLQKFYISTIVLDCCHDLLKKTISSQVLATVLVISNTYRTHL